MSLEWSIDEQSTDWDVLCQILRSDRSIQCNDALLMNHDVVRDWLFKHPLEDYSKEGSRSYCVCLVNYLRSINFRTEWQNRADALRSDGKQMQMQVDHIVPIEEGGLSAAWNLGWIPRLLKDHDYGFINKNKWYGQECISEVEEKQKALVSLLEDRANVNERLNMLNMRLKILGSTFEYAPLDDIDAFLKSYELQKKYRDAIR